MSQEHENATTTFFLGTNPQQVIAPVVEIKPQQAKRSAEVALEEKERGLLML